MAHRLNAPTLKGRERGFTLVELAIVLVIVGLLIGGMVLSLTAQQDATNLKETQRRIALAQEALLGFAAANGRLPCPAAPPAAGGAESPLNTGACNNPLNGYFPATTLGLAPTDAQGYLVDAWGNPIRYAVYPTAIAAQNNPFTTPNAMRTLTIQTISATPNFLFVCGGGTTVTATTCGAETVLTNNAVAVIFSMGKNGGVAPAGDEALNTDNNVVFVSKTASDFDDVVAWVSPNILYNRMIAAGRLP